MRGLPLLLLAGCSTWTSWETMDPETRPAVIAALRAPAGRATIVHGDRMYMAPPGALRPDVAAFAGTLADAIAAGEAADPRIPAGWDDGRDVIALTYADRVLATDALLVTSIRLDDGSLSYRVETEVRPDRFVWATVPGTPEIDGAWERLVESARGSASAALPWHNGPPGPRVFFRDVGVDVRGTGGAR